MEVKSGYKQTEIGVIPEDWDTVSLKELTSEIGDGIHSTPIYSNNGDYYFINGNNLENGKIVITSDTKRAKLSEYKKYKKNLGDRSILLSINGTIGNLAYYKGEPIILGKSAAYINIKEDHSKHYIYYSLKTKYVHNFFNDELTGTTIKNLGLGSIRRTLIAIPRDINEQRVIATALSDTDALITGLERLIEKKRNIKKGAMQELLTGKRRLPGFTGEWVEKTIQETTICLDNLRIPLNESQRSLMKGDIPYCGANGILDYVNDYVIDDEIILIAEDGGYFDEYASRPIAYKMSGKCWVNNHAHILKAKDDFVQDFIFYSLVHKNILEYLASGTRAKLNKKEMYKIKIDLPPTRKEQQAILSDMDAEIEALEMKLAKYRDIKKGMMQELLTGKTRLV